MGDQRIAGNTFVERNECLTVLGADDQIGLPVTETFAAVGYFRTQVNLDLIRDRPPPLTNAVALSSSLLAAQSAVQGSTGSLVGIDTLVDALVTDGWHFVRLEITGDLFRAPCFGKFCFDDAPGFIRDSAAVVTSPHAGQRQRFCPLRTIAALATISSKLATDRRRVSIHEDGNFALAFSGFQKDGNLVSFVLGEVCVHSGQL